MHRWTSILAALMLVLMLWTGGAARAAERFDCIPVTAGAASLFAGDQGQVPASPEQCVTHQHTGCSGHHEAAPSGPIPVAVGNSREAVPLAWGVRGMPGQDPQTQLRPPMA